MANHESRSIMIGRLCIGLAQGLALYLLYASADSHSWPATEPLAFGPLLLVAGFTPLILLTTLGHVKLRTLMLWGIGSAVVVAAIGAYDMYRAGETAVFSIWAPDGPGNQHIIPSLAAMLLSAAGLFISQSLIVAAEAEKKFLANYPTYFDAAWKHAIQLGLSGPFVGVFWGLLFLGAGLFKLIKIDVFWDLIHHSWFAIPATAIVLSGALHMTDVRASIVQGIRTLTLTLLSWLLPLAALIATGFLVALPFTGLAPLWATGHGTALLLGIEAAILVLINAAYQDGAAEHRANRVLRWSGSVAAATLAPLVAITAYGLALRVGQYGWSTERVLAGALILVAGTHALGYAWAAIARGPWLRSIERWNVITAFVVIVVLLALLTPVADPARLTVADQMARLRAGKIEPQQLDFTYLRFYAGRYGQAALQQLKENPPAAFADYVRGQAEAALNKTSPYPSPFVTPRPAVVTANITVHPETRALPDDFKQRDWAGTLKDRAWLLPRCLRDSAGRCDAYFVDVNGDGVEEIILVEPSPNDGRLFQKQPDGSWRMEGRINLPRPCARVIDALRDGEVKTVAPKWQDLEIAGIRLHVDPSAGEERQVCN